MMDNLDEQNVGGNILEIEAKTLGGGGGVWPAGRQWASELLSNKISNFTLEILSNDKKDTKFFLGFSAT